MHPTTIQQISMASKKLSAVTFQEEDHCGIPEANEMWPGANSGPGHFQGDFSTPKRLPVRTEEVAVGWRAGSPPGAGAHARGQAANATVTQAQPA